MAGKRVLAALLAVLMVVGAVFVRRLIDGESVVPSNAQVICDEALADACRETFDSVTIEAPGVTLDRLAASPAEIVWVTDRVWLEILEDEWARRGRTIELNISDPVALSELVLVSSERTAETCGGPMSWTCASSQLDLGLDSADTTIGLLSRGQLVADFLGTQSFASNDLDRSYRDWRRDADQHLDTTLNGPALDILLTRPGSIDVAVSSQARLDTLNRADAIAQPGGGRSLTVVVAGIDGANPRTERALSIVLQNEGWEAAATSTGTQEPGPSAGVLQALRTDW